MDFFFISLFVFFVSISLTIFYNLKKLPGSSSLLPPGKMGFPVIGESLEFLSAGWKGHPEKFIFDRMAKYSTKVFKTHMLGETVAVFCGATCNKFLFSNEGKLVQTWWPGSLQIIFPNPEKSTIRDEAYIFRQVLPNFFKQKGIKSYIGAMDRVAQRLFSNGWEKKDQVEAYPLCKDFTISLALSLFVSVEDRNEIAAIQKNLDVIGGGIVSLPIGLPGTPFSKACKASKKTVRQLLAIAKKRKVDLSEGKDSVPQDMLSYMLTTPDGSGKFTSEAVVARKIQGMLLGGYQTSSSFCTFVVKFLADFPDIYEKVYREQMSIAETKASGELLNWDDVQKMKYSWNVAREVLRLSPPVQGAFREALTDIVIDGYTIPKGWKLFWSVHTTHRNPECFPDPMKFDPSRFEGDGPAPYTFVPFGGGTRICPGIDYSRLLILVFMHNLVRRFRWQKILPHEDVIVDLSPFPAKGLPVRLFPHNA